MLLHGSLSTLTIGGTTAVAFEIRARGIICIKVIQSTWIFAVLYYVHVGRISVLARQDVRLLHFLCCAAEQPCQFRIRGHLLLHVLQTRTHDLLKVLLGGT